MATLTYSGLLRLELINRFPLSTIREVREIRFDPDFHLCTIRDAFQFFYYQLAGRYGFDHDFPLIVWDIAVTSYYHIQTRGLSVSFFWDRVVPPPPGFEDVTPIPYGGAVTEYSSDDENSSEYSSDDETSSEYSSDGDEVSLGLSEHEIALLKKEKFEGEDEDRMCSVCLDEFREGAVVTKLSPCSHEFHNECIVTWLRKNGTCPCCRSRCVV